MPLKKAEGKSKEEKQKAVSFNIKELKASNKDRVAEGKKPRKQDQIVAIALKEAGLSKKKTKKPLNESMVSFIESFSTKFPMESIAIKKAFVACFEGINGQTQPGMVNAENKPEDEQLKLDVTNKTESDLTKLKSETDKLIATASDATKLKEIANKKVEDATQKTQEEINKLGNNQ